ncbi:MAG: translation elongation factor Ts [Sulfurimonas sp.]|uniref:translation elongation factor Ts n=1 Tax=Sulfurimonas sp. TaxID=2022749 RepID=UPI00260AD944|nr:translation elongation factor Ts [Sulfurimonas sp.]MCW8895714.1 translation elongation factor Ts [Sulfurimonas sp.]MCW8953686.1 translation elongation factor Ts [Sulfurimonas sp.]MCW9068238.1 translation elongation factor Ts [Sulfurimonas sp.]
MAVTAAQVKELRAATDAPMMDCKKALVENDGDMAKATEWLKERGIAKAAKKADRVAAEGLVGFKIADDFSQATVVEINSETDFVAQNEGFKNLVLKTTEEIYSTSPADVESIKSTEFGSYFAETVAKIGEKIDIRRFATLKADDDTVALNGYIHSNNRIAVIVLAKCDSAKTAEGMKPFLKNVAMHASAMKPTTLSYKNFDPEYVESETKGRIEALKKENEELSRLKKPLKNVPQYISMMQLTDAVMAQAEADIKEALKAQGKPEQIWDKIVPGQIARFILDNTLLDQEQALLDQQYVLDDKLTVAQAVQAEAKKLGGSAEIVDFVRLEVGEGIEKKEDDFAAEVAAQMG